MASWKWHFDNSTNSSSSLWTCIWRHFLFPLKKRHISLKTSRITVDSIVLSAAFSSKNQNKFHSPAQLGLYNENPPLTSQRTTIAVSFYMWCYHHVMGEVIHICSHALFNQTKDGLYYCTYGLVGTFIYHSTMAVLWTWNVRAVP